MTNEELIEKLKRQVLQSEELEEAMLRAPRELFVPEEFLDDAYEDYPLPIGFGQTVSQPFTVVVMTELLDVEPGHKIMEIGAGSGWQAALLGHLVGPEGKVFTIERSKELVKLAKENIGKTGLNNIEIHHGDGTLGLEEKAPFDRIIITAAAPKIPPPVIEQLKEGGKLVAPVGDMLTQQMILYEKTSIGLQKKRNLGHYRFVPLVGRHGFRCRVW